MPRWFKIALWVLAVLLLCCAALYAYLIYSIRHMEFDFSKSDLAHYEAELDFQASLSGSDCLTQDMITQEADARGWDWLVEPTFQWQACPAAATPWLRVTVEPALFMSTDNENAAFFVFDAQGCSIDWADSLACGD